MTNQLESVHLYKHEAVVRFFCAKHPQYSLEEGHVLFQDLLSWLWLNETRKKMNKDSYLFGPLLILDELWHVFILHTQDYMDFSLTYFGAYVHHQVEPVGQEHELSEEEFIDFIQDCFKYLGQNWVERRFSEAFAS